MLSNQNSKTIADGIIRAFLSLSFIFLALYGIYLLKSLVIYCLLSLVLFMACHPIKKFLNNQLRFSNVLASITALSIFIFITGFLFSLLVPFITSQSQNINQIDIGALKIQFGEWLSESKVFLSKYNLNFLKNFNSETILENIHISFFADFLNDLIGIIQSFSIATLSTIFIAYFLIKDHSYFYQSGLNLIKNKSLSSKIDQAIKQIRERLTKYFFGVFIQTVSIFILYSLTLFISGVNDTFSIAAIAAIFNIIPYLGPVIGFIIMLVFTAIEVIPLDFPNLFPVMASKIFIGFTIAQLIDNFFNQPIIFSKTLKFHPLEIFIVIIGFGLLFDLIGVILAIPMYTVIKVTLKQFSIFKYDETKINP